MYEATVTRVQNENKFLAMTRYMTLSVRCGFTEIIPVEQLESILEKQVLLFIVMLKMPYTFYSNCSCPYFFFTTV